MQETTFEKELSIVSNQQELREDIFVVGVDEAGRGPLAGPVVACATTVRNFQFPISNFQYDQKEEKMWNLIRDSKTLSEKQRGKAFDFIHKYFYVGVGIVSSETIDRINILQATFLAMKSAIADLQKQTRGDVRCRMQDTGKEEQLYCLIDGNQVIPNLSVKQEAIVNGDGSVKSIAAASIIAKVTRDRIMKTFDQKYPAYGFAKHKGYGTKKHLNALRRLGPCPIHRMSFRPVLLSLPENVNRRFSGSLAKARRS